MYKKAMGSLAVLYIVFLLSVAGVGRSRGAGGEDVQPVAGMKLDETVLSDAEKSVIGIQNITISEQRVIGCATIEREYVYEFPENDLDMLLRIVEAEAGGEDEDGKLLVANVVLNRVADDNFPDTVTEVVLQKEKGVCQFSPASNGKLWSVQISEETEQAVKRALEGEDISQGALYFVARKYADSERIKWFDSHLTFLFKHGGHDFFG